MPKHFVTTAVTTMLKVMYLCVHICSNSNR